MAQLLEATNMMLAGIMAVGVGFIIFLLTPAGKKFKQSLRES